jgi:DNA-binding MarR family transcriptional regulator
MTLPTIDPEVLDALRGEDIGRLLLRAYRSFSAQIQVKLAARGHDRLSAAHLTMLANIEAQGTRITALAERTNMTKQSVSDFIAELEQLGYVARLPDPADRRATMIIYSELGVRFCSDAFAVKQEIARDFTALLGEDGFHQLQSLLGRLVTSIE